LIHQAFLNFGTGFGFSRKKRNAMKKETKRIALNLMLTASLEEYLMYLKGLAVAK